MRPDPIAVESKNGLNKRNNEVRKILEELGFMESEREMIFYHDDFPKTMFNMRGADKKTIMLFIRRNLIVDIKELI